MENLEENMTPTFKEVQQCFNSLLNCKYEVTVNGTGRIVVDLNKIKDAFDFYFNIEEKENF